jgi:hypothetical protein
VKEIKAAWVNVVLGCVSLIALAFGGYGHFSAVLADKEARIVVLEKEQLVSLKDREGMDNELDVLWVDTKQNRVGIDRNKEDIERSNEVLGKFSDAVDRLIISVTRLEEKIKS